MTDGVIGIGALFSGESGKRMIEEGKAMDRAARKGGPSEAVEDPIASSRPEAEQVTVPGGGSQDTGTEYTTSEFEDHEPNDQEQDLDAGPNTEDVPKAAEVVTAATKAHADAAAILNQQLDMLNRQTLSDDPADLTVGVNAPPSTVGSTGEEIRGYETIMPGGKMYGECLGAAGALLDELGEASGGASTVRLDKRRAGAVNIGQGKKNKLATAISADPEEKGNPVTGDGTPPDYLAQGEEGTDSYPTVEPEMGTGTSGKITTTTPTKQPLTASISHKDAAKVYSAVQLISEGYKATDVARLLLDF